MQKIIQKSRKEVLAEIKEVHGEFLKAHAAEMGGKVGDIETYLDGMRLEGELASLAEYRGFLDALNALEHYAKPRTICVEIQGGVLVDVHGLRDGDTYEIADHDNAEGDAKAQAAIEKMIERADAQ